MFLDIKIDTPSVFLTPQVFFRHKNWHPKCFLTHQVFFRHKNWHPKCFFRHTKCFLDIKIDTPSVFLTHQVFFRHKNWHPKCFLTHQVFFKVQFPLVSSLLELQSKSWVLELKLEPSALQELSQSCSSDSAFRKGLTKGNLLYLCNPWKIFFPYARKKWTCSKASYQERPYHYSCCEKRFRCCFLSDVKLNGKEKGTFTSFVSS